MYVTPDQLADEGMARELAQVATPDADAVIEDALMEATLRGTDRSAWSADQIAVADAALARITSAIDDADSLIDGYLVNRKPTAYSVPLDPVPGLVSVWSRWIMRYLLHKDRVGTAEATDPIVRDYQEAKRFLALTQAGQFSLGANDPQPPPSSGAPAVSAPRRIFCGDVLDDFVRDFGT